MKKQLLLLASALLFCVAGYAQTTLYLVGDDYNNWSFTNNPYSATSNTGVYTWTNSSTTPLALSAGSGFKISTTGWPSDNNWGSSETIDLSSGTATINVNSSGSSANIKGTAALTITQIVLDTNAKTVTITGSQGEAVDPSEVALYIRGTVNSWLDTEIAAGTDIDEKWLGERASSPQYSDYPNEYTWDWTGTTNGYENLKGQFKFAGTAYTIHNYGAQLYNSPLTESDAGGNQIGVQSGTLSNFVTGYIADPETEEAYEESEITYSDLRVTTVKLYMSESWSTGVLMLTIYSPSAIDETTIAVNIYSVNGEIVVSEGSYSIFNLEGKDVTSINGQLNKGNYIVKTEQGVSKIAVD